MGMQQGLAHMVEKLEAGVFKEFSVEKTGPTSYNFRATIKDGARVLVQMTDGKTDVYINGVHFTEDQMKAFDD